MLGCSGDQNSVVIHICVSNESDGNKRERLKLSFNSSGSSRKPHSHPGYATSIYLPPVERGWVTYSIQTSGKLKISPEVTYDFTAEDLTDLGEIGRGAFGTVNKMVHAKSDTVMAVTMPGSLKGEKRSKPSAENMTAAMGGTLKDGIPVRVAPERIAPGRARGYDVRSDVWSLGITLIEVSTGRFPYPKWNSVFEQLTQVVQGDPPQISPNENGNTVTLEFVNFVNTCLIKEEQHRPKYKRLLEHSFVVWSERETVNLEDYICSVLNSVDKSS